MSKFRTEKVTWVHHWTDKLFSFKTTRDPGFKFENGQFAMIGLMVNGKPLLRAYSMVSANHEDFLEFYSIKVPDGPLTSRLQHLKVGDDLVVGNKPTGTLVLDSLQNGPRLWLLSTGTGLAAFLSVVKDPYMYEKFEKIILVHGCRETKELTYEEFLTRELPEHEFLGELAREQLIYYPTVTREPFKNQGRITTLIESHKLTQDLGFPDLSIANDRFMLCGSEAMLKDIKRMLEERGFAEGTLEAPGQFVVEKAFAER
jgi:ferredoxin/flavodoxin---NADP+ reductase